MLGFALTPPSPPLLLLPQTGRHNYVTPTSYLELIMAFTTLVAAKRTEVCGVEGQARGGVGRAGGQQGTCATAAPACCAAARTAHNPAPRDLHLQVLNAQHRYEKGLDKLESTARQVRRSGGARGARAPMRRGSALPALACVRSLCVHSVRSVGRLCTRAKACCVRGAHAAASVRALRATFAGHVHEGRACRRYTKCH